MNGIYAPKNTDLFYQYTTLAYEQIDNYKNYLEFILARMNLAWATCLGYGDSKDLDKCYKLVDHEQLTAQNIPLTSRAKSMLNNAIVDILINNDGRLNNSELQRFRALLAKQLEVKLATASINEKPCYDKTVRIEDNMIIEEGDKIELCFRFEGSAFSKKYRHNCSR